MLLTDLGIILGLISVGGFTLASFKLKRRVVINSCYGGFSLSSAAYERLAEYGVPIQKRYEATRGPNGRYIEDPRNAGLVIFDNALDEHSDEAINKLSKTTVNIGRRYWDCWTRENREHPLLLRVINDLGPEVASGKYAKLKIVEIPIFTEYTIEEYDGMEHIAEKHKTWS